ncbi:MAG: peroxide stress protein YaaA [Pigmentiphaga sp.]|uniref:peroxide stress protein YaaA n=1 Tax=Pigmentiphaga sp. TaxID=1977564 RepID=UPI0029AD83E0|nr:peroxide stress protein YaaA [Pigmentiphaga sp.]MDX3908112.1 peroxide stress protein YaaA [Pigmentiphaga sp.]
MLFLLSPAKKLDYDTPAHVDTATQPLFVDRAKKLISVLKTKSAGDIAGLMNLSPALAELNVARYAKWTPKFTAENAKQAVLAFNGDVYEGLNAGSLTAKQLDWAQEHVVILSGLYGALRPLDLMQPYRLEMGTRLATAKGKNLYEYWGSEISDYLNQRQEADKHPVVVNLASEEYFKAVDRKALKARVIQCVFEDWKGGAYKVISFHAKRARGLMVRYAIEKRIAKPEALQGFDLEGYAYDGSVSSADKLVFRRKSA